MAQAEQDVAKPGKISVRPFRGGSTGSGMSDPSLTRRRQLLVLRDMTRLSVTEIGMKRA
jgi:hypothetical protein